MRFLGMPPTNPGAYCEYITVPADFAFPVPDGMSAEHGSMIEPLAVGLHAVELAGVLAGQTVAVLGTGSIGLFTTRCAKLAGVHTIYATDLMDCRLEAARHLGADVTVNAAETDPVASILDATGGRGVDIVFEAAGVPETPQHAIDIVVPGGTIVMIGICAEQPVKTDITEARRKELVVKHCRRFCHNFPRAIAMAAAGAVDMDRVDTHRFGLDNIADGFEIVKNYRDGVIKATVQIPGG
jgi:L-iditol 2-dehydrogenase